MDSDSFEVKVGFIVTHSRSTIGISPSYTVCGRSARRFSKIIMPSLALTHKFFPKGPSVAPRVGRYSYSHLNHMSTITIVSWGLIQI